jgi:hypothetical protein
MGRVLKTSSGGGASGAAAGLSSAAAKTLIEDNAEFTFIKTYPISSNISSFIIPTADVNQTKYDVFKFLCKGNKWHSNGQPYFWLGGNTISSVSWYGNGRNTYNSGDGYFGGQINSSSGNFNMEMTFRWINGYIHADGWQGMGQQGGYYDHHRRFNIIGDTAAGTYATDNGLQMRNFYLGAGTGLGTQWDDKVYLYGMKRVSS